MTRSADKKELTPSLEDYLETILELVRTRPVARIKEIAEARGVRSASVTPAMRRLEDLGLIKYGRREYIELTAKGQVEAQRVFARHQVLATFFEKVLRLTPREATEEACAMEHHLSNRAMDQMVKLFEYLKTCPNASESFLEDFHNCHLVHGEKGNCTSDCTRPPLEQGEEVQSMSLAEMLPGIKGRVVRVESRPAVRQRLLDMGILPGSRVEVERVAPTGDPIWIRVHNYQLTLRKTEAEGVQVEVNAKS